MAFLLEIDFRDVNGKTASRSCYINQESDAPLVVKMFDDCSNALITAARILTPVPLQLITGNSATNDNVETAKTKAKVKLRGADAGSLAQPFDYVTISIPAPIGTLINGQSGDVSNSELQSLKTKVLSRAGVQMDTIEKVYYSRGK